MPTELQCPNCRTRFRAQDSARGKTLPCSKCGAPVAIPKAKGVGPQQTVYSHLPRESAFEVAVGEVESIEAISEHIQRHIGPVEMVFHELISDLVHIDVHWVRPTSERPFHTLITSGMSDKAMTVPEGAEELRYCELVICLPAAWPLDMDSLRQEANYWPVRWLKKMARMPHEYRTWLGVFHTVPNGDPPQPLGPGTKLCYCCFLPPLLADGEFGTLSLDDERTIHFLALVPLYREEMAFKLKFGMEKLIDRFDEAKVNELLNVRRRNVCRRRWWPF